MVFTRVFIVLAVLISLAPPANAGDVFSEVMPGIRAFLERHNEFGAPAAIQSVPDWAQGKRQRVQFKNGRNLLFYLKEGKVVSVYEDHPKEGRKKIWGEFSTLPQDALTDRQQEADGSVPAYTIIQSMNLARGGKHADILIPTLSRDAPKATRESIAVELLKMEGLTGVSLFSTREACKAHYSASFAKANSNASEGFLGQISPGSTEFVDLQ